MKRIKLIILGFFLISITYGQNIDSLKVKLTYANNKNDTSVISTVEPLIDYYIYKFPDSALFFLKKIEKKYNFSDDSERYAQIEIFSGDVFYAKKDYYEAVSHYYKALIALPENKENLYGNILTKISKSLLSTGFDVELAKNYILETINISSDTSYNKALAYALLSNILAKQHKIDSAFSTINQAITIVSTSANLEQKAEIFYYFANIYTFNKEYTRSFIYLKKSISLTENSSKSAEYLEELANLYTIAGYFQSAENIYKQAEIIFQKYDNNVAICELYINLSKLYFKQAQSDKAIYYAQKALTISRYLNIQVFQEQAYYQLSQIYSQKQNIDLALISFKKYSQIRDSISVRNNERESELLYNNYLLLIKLKDRQILYNQKKFQELQNKKQRLAIYILAISGILLISVLLVVLYLYNMKRRNEYRLRQLTQATLEGIIIHDGFSILEVNDKFCEISGFERKDLIGNNIYTIISPKFREIVRKKLNLKRTVFYQIELLRKDETTYEAELLSKPFLYKNTKAKVVSIRDLSEIREIQEKLHATKQQFEALIETSPDGVVITDTEGYITYVSPAFAELFGFKTEFFINKKLSEFLTPIYQKKIEVDLHNILYGNYCGITEYVAKNSENKEFHIECNGNVLKDLRSNIAGVFMIVRDVTERKIVENALIESESRFRGLFNNTNDAIVVQTKDYRIIDANPYALKLFGIDYETFLNMDFRDLLKPELHKIDYEKFIKNNEAFEEYITTADNRKIYIQCRIAKLTFENNFFYLLSIRDLTDLKQQELHLKEIAEKLAQSNATKDKMFSIIAHDLRGPIGNLKSMLEYISENPDEFNPDEILQIINNLRTTSTQTFELLINLLNWAKSQQNIMEYNPDIHNIKNLITPVIDISKQLAKAKNIQIFTKIPENLQIIADENMIKTVVRNLLSNAIKFTHNNGKIFVEVYENNKFAEITVKDTGVGISQENIAKIFDQNTYFTTYGTNNEKGTGLGLKLCYDFVKRNNGQMWVESEKDNGTTFFFTLKKA